MDFSNSSTNTEDEIDINLTPLIDIIFLLLIFFMLTTTFDKKQNISVNLPGASKTKQVKTKTTPTEITITADSDIFIDSKKHSLSSLKTFLRNLIDKDPKTSLILRADGEVKHSKIVEVLDLSKREKIENISIAVKPK